MEQANEIKIEEVIAYAKSLPEFPHKTLVVERLETRNLNRYQEALLKLNEVIVEHQDPAPDASGTAVTREQLQHLIDKIASMESNEQVAE